MPIVSNDTIRAIYEVCGDPLFPVDEYCIGCENCEHYGFPCINCAAYVFGDRLGPGEGGEANVGGGGDMEVDSEPNTPNNRESEIPCSWSDEDQLSREGHILPPSSPTSSEESVTSPSAIDPDSPLGLLLQHC